MERNEPSVSVIMPVKDDGENLRISITSVLKQNYAAVNEIILGVGPSSDGTREIVNELEVTEPRIKVIQNPSGKTASALNAAASVATGDYLVRVDAHCRLEKDYIQKAIRTIIRTDAANVGGIQKAEGESNIERSIATAMSSRFGVGNSKFHYGGQEGPSDTVYLGVYNSNIFRELGGFNETLVRNQDYELNIRIRESGNIVWFDPNLVVRYRPRSSLKALFLQYFQYGRWKRSVLKIHPTSLRIRQIMPPLLIIGILFGIAVSVFFNLLGLLIPCIYLGSIAVASLIQKSRRATEKLFLMLIFPTMHIAWGLGFLFGK
tara:strand:- start:590 stop:1546 length:957 start_codon:yes stop_codon:yes gene_type:complete